MSARRTTVVGVPAFGARLVALMLASATATAPAGTADGVGARAAVQASPASADLRLRDWIYDPQAVLSVPVKRGVVTLLVLDAEEAITELASGLGGDCAKPDSAWCIAAQAGGRTVFVKPKSSASATNNLAIVSTRRVHTLRLEVLADEDPRPALHRLAIHAPRAAQPLMRAPDAPTLDLLARQALQLPPLPSREELVSARMQAKPIVRNTRYALAEGADSEDIVPSLVFDDGRFTYLRFAGQREVPAVFQVLGDGSEALVNVRMEDELLVVDRVCRRLMLRAGNAVVALWNEAFDIDGVASDLGTTVPGVRRVFRQGSGLLGPPHAGSSTEAAARPRVQSERQLPHERTPPPDRRPALDATPETSGAPALPLADPRSPRGDPP